LQEVFDFADSQVGRIGSGGRKGALAAFRDTVCFKVIYAWGLFSGGASCANRAFPRFVQVES